MSETISHYRRFHGYDYKRGASLFITIATAPRKSLFGRVENAAVALSPFGTTVLEAMEAIPRFNPGIRIFEHVLMPDHLHMNLRIEAGLANPLQTLGNAIRRFKSFTTALARKFLGLSSIWQQGYHDRVCTSRAFIEAVTRYIAYNPLKYELMYNQPEFMRIREPLDTPLLAEDAYWKGMGNVSLLDEGAKLLSLRVSRKVPATGLKAVVGRIENAVEAGFTVISGFISPGEVAVRDMLVANKMARFVHILPSCMGVRHRPDSRYMMPLAEGRFLEIAKGNDETEFGRAACLDLNAEIEKMARASAGGALYWKQDGPRYLRGVEPSLRGTEPAHQDGLRRAEPAHQDGEPALVGWGSAPHAPLRGAEPARVGWGSAPHAPLRRAEPAHQDEHPAHQDGDFH